MNKLVLFVCILVTNITFLSTHTCLAFAIRNPSSLTAPHKSLYYPHQHASCHHFDSNSIISALRGGSTRFSVPLATKSTNGFKDQDKLDAEKSMAVPEQPTLYQLIRFYLPCLGLWLSGPLLSLVDTAFVGLTAAPGKTKIILHA